MAAVIKAAILPLSVLFIFTRRLRACSADLRIGHQFFFKKNLSAPVKSVAVLLGSSRQAHVAPPSFYQSRIPSISSYRFPTNLDPHSRLTICFFIRFFDLLSPMIIIPKKLFAACLLRNSFANVQVFITFSIRFLHAAIQDYVFTPTFLPALLFRVRSVLFPMNARLNPIPNSHPAPPSAPRSTHLNEQVPGTVDSGPDVARTGNFSPGHISVSASSSPMPLSLPEAQRRKPSDSEIAVIKRKCAASILSLIPRPVARAFFRVSPNDVITTPSEPQEESRSGIKRVNDIKGNQEEGSISPSKGDDLEELLLLSAIEDSVLDVFADEYCNKYLLYSIVETVLVRLFPELSEHSVAELMEERGVAN